MIKLFKYFKKKEILFLIMSVVFIVTQVWLDLKMPDYMSEITMLVKTEGSELSDVISAGLKMLACALGSLLSSVIVAIGASGIASGFTATLREKLFNKVQSFSMEEIGKFSTASLITRSTNDVTQIQMVIVMGLQSVVKAPILAVWAICKISGKASEWTISTAVSVIFLIVVVFCCVMVAMPLFRKMQSFTDDVNRVTRENLTGLKVVRAYNAEDYQMGKFEVANDVVTNAHLKTGRTMAFLTPSIQLVMSGLPLAIYWIGAYLIDKAEMMDKITVFSDMVVFSSYAIQVIMAFMLMVIILMIYPRAQVSAQRINEVLNTKASIEDGNSESGKNGVKGEVEFKDVSFKYSESEGEVLENISFKVERGKTLAIIGSTGCGKSTLINLIPRFYDATKGEILVDGLDVRKYNQKSLHAKIGYVPQKSFLFSGDIKSNICFGDIGIGKATEEDIKKASYVSCSEEFIENLDKKYDSFVAQGGSNYSGGQKQRLSIARAVSRKPEILIFDDSFSALDYKTDRKVRSLLKEEFAETTKIIVAQRIGTIIDADEIIVLDEGKIAGKGKHADLLKNCTVYQQIALSQLSKEELDNA